MTTPTPPPCDSPKVVMRKSCPKVLPIAAEPNCGAQDSQRATEDGSGERTRPRVLLAVPRRNELSAGLETKVRDGEGAIAPAAAGRGACAPQNGGTRFSPSRRLYRARGRASR